MALHISALVDRALPDLALLREAADEAERRLVTTRSLDIIDYKEPDGKEKSEDDVLMPGTVTLILARRGSKSFENAMKSLKKTGRFDADTLRRVRASYAKRSMMTMPQALELMKSQSTIVELIGGRFTLAASLFVPEDLEMVLAPMPYNGGPLDGVGFQLIERHAEDMRREPYEAILVRRSPRLTRAEKEALKLVPRSSFDMNIGRVAMCYAITAVTVVAVVMFATSACPGKLVELHLDEEDMKSMSPEMTSRMLIRLRRKILERGL